MRPLIASVWLVWSSSVLACDCGMPPLPERVRLSTHVFLAEVVVHTPLQSVELRVLERFKGQPRSRLSVATGRSDCDFFLPPTVARPGDRFLVFMTRTRLGNTVSRCLGSAPVAAAPRELELLRGHPRK